jgi:mannan endo-1,4-beta-mannosidase
MKYLSFKTMSFGFCIVLSVQTFAIEPANPNANSNVRLILNYFSTLKTQTDHRLVSGQFIGYSDGVNNYGVVTSIFNNTAKWVGIVGSDYAHWSPNHHIRYDYTNPELIKAWKAGSLVTLQVMMTNPANPDGGGLWDTGVDFNQLLDPGTATYSRWISEMDIIAAGLSQLQDSGVVVLFRPFHEMNGAWFWWGGKPTALFVKVWKQMFDYFTTTKKLNNLLWVYGPMSGSTATSYYPGDNYVDITGFDAYTSTVSNSGIGGYYEMVQLGKPFGFTEFGPENASSPSGNFDYRLFINGLKTNFPAACFFLCWNDKWGMASNQYVKEALSDNYVANRDNLNWSSTTGLIQIEKNSSGEDIKVYPNPLPAGSGLQLKLNGFASGYEMKVSVFDIAGKTVMQKIFSGYSGGIFEFNDAKSLQQGIYLLNIVSNSKSANVRLEVQ